MHGLPYCRSHRIYATLSGVNKVYSNVLNTVLSLIICVLRVQEFGVAMYLYTENSLQ